MYLIVFAFYDAFKFVGGEDVFEKPKISEHCSFIVKYILNT